MFDMPEADAAMLLDEAVVSAAAKMGYVMDRPKSIALDVGEMLVGGGSRGGPPRADRWVVD